MQVYASAPDVKLEKPEEELVAFDKTGLLEPGDSETLEFELESKDLASFDTENSNWIVEAGNYMIKVGASAKNLKNEAGLTVEKDIIAGSVTRALAPDRTFAIMSKIK